MIFNIIDEIQHIYENFSVQYPIKIKEYFLEFLNRVDEDKNKLSDLIDELFDAKLGSNKFIIIKSATIE